MVFEFKISEFSAGRVYPILLSCGLPHKALSAIVTQSFAHPRVQIYKSTSGGFYYLVVSSYINGANSLAQEYFPIGLTSTNININQWVRLDIRQMKVEDHYVFSASIDGKLLGSVVNQYPSSYKDVVCRTYPEMGFRGLVKKFDYFIDPG